MISYREGLTIDLMASLLQKWALNSWAWVSITAMMMVTQHLELAECKFLPRAPLYLLTLSALLGLVSIGLSLNGYLNRQLNNNWTLSSGWDWTKEVVVITGGSGGIGARVAQMLLERNSATRIVIVDYIPMTWEPPKNTDVHYYRGDLSQPQIVMEVCKAIRQDVGHPTVLINNAGLCRGFPVIKGSYSDNEITIRTNLLAPILFIKEFAPEMVKNDHGHIINVSSMSALLPPAGVADYAATKAGLIALHESLQIEHGCMFNAPRVRHTLAVLSFIKTPLFKGETRQSNFWFPLLHVDTVSTEIVGALYSGYGRTIFMPGIMRYVASLKGGPEWLGRILRDCTTKLGVDYKGRQKLNKDTGGLE